MNTKSKNLFLYYLQYSTYSCINLIAVGAVFQTFMLECGIDETRVSLCISALQIIQTLTMLFIAKAAENIKSVLKTIAICLFSHSLLLSSMLFICLKQNISINTKYIILFAAGVIFNLFFSLYNILSYKQPHHIMNIRDYGKASGQSGVISGALGVLTTASMSFALSRFSYFRTMTIICIIGLVLTAISSLISFVYTPLKFDDTKNQIEKINIFHYKPFYQLLIPNFMRGISTGMFNLIAVIGYYCNVLDSTAATILVTLSQIAMLISCQSFSFLAKKRKTALLCLISSIALLIFLPLMLLGNSKILFLGFYFIVFFFLNYIAYGVPVIVAEHIDYNCLGQYTAWRMGLFTLGVALGGALVPVLLKFVGGMATLAICGAAMLPCGIGYYIFEKSKAKY